MDNAGKKILITGAAGHLGGAMVKRLSKEGAELVIVGRRLESLVALKESLEMSDKNCLCLVADVANYDCIMSLSETLKGAGISRLDGVVLNAFPVDLNFSEDNLASKFSVALAASLAGPEQLIRNLQPFLYSPLEGSPSASIVTIGSIYGQVSPDSAIYSDEQSPSQSWYGVAKAALQQLTRYLAAELAPTGIRVNCLVPGAFPSPSSLNENPGFEDRLARKIPMDRIGQPAELAGFVSFLLSDDSSYVTGNVINVDGGFTLI